MTDKGKMRTVCFTVEPEFKNVEALMNKFIEQSGMSKAAFFRTIMHEYTGVPRENMAAHKTQLAIIKKVLGRA